MEAKDLLMADLEHFGASMIHNEVVGEKRFEFFVTFVTAVLGGLVALAASSSNWTNEDLVRTTVAGLAGLLVMGMLTYVRMLHRNRVTDQYQETLEYIRRVYTEASPVLKEARYAVPVVSGAKPRLTGGYAQTVGVINGALFGGLVYLAWNVWNGWNPPNASAVEFRMDLLLALAAGLTVTVGLWFVASLRGR